MTIQGRAARALVALGRTLGVTIVALVSLATGITLHGNLAIARRILAKRVSSLVSAEVAGTVEVRTLASFGMRSIELEGLAIHAPDRVRVLAIDRLRLDGPDWLAWLAVVGGGTRLNFPELTAGELAIDLSRDAEGVPRLVRALGPRPGPPGPPPAPGRPRFHVTLERLSLSRITLAFDESLHAPACEIRDLTARLGLTRERLLIDFDQVQLNVGAGVAAATIRGALELPRREDGTFGESPTARLDGEGRLRHARFSVGLQARDARERFQFEVHELDLRSLSEIWPDASRAPSGPLSLLVDADRVAGFLGFKAKIALPSPQAANATTGATLDLHGRVHLATGTGSLDVSGNHLDLATLAPSAPRTSLDVAAHLVVDAPRRTARGSVTSSQTSSIASPSGVLIDLPALAGTLELAGDAVELRAALDEPGAPTALVLRRSPEGALAIEAHAVSPKLQAVERLRAESRAAARFDGSGVVSVEARVAEASVDATVRAEVADISVPAASLRLPHARLDVRLFGPQSALSIDARLVADGAVVGAQRLSQSTLVATGAVSHPRLGLDVRADTGAVFRGSAMLDWARHRVTGANGTVSRDGATVDASFAVAHLEADGTLGLDGLHVEDTAGGRLDGTVQLGRASLTGNVHGTALDLNVWSRLLGGAKLGGTLDLHAELPSASSERIAIRLHGVSTEQLVGIDGEVALTRDGRKVEPHASIAIRGVADGTACSGPLLDGVLDGHLVASRSALDRSSLLESTGTLDLHRMQVDLGCATSWPGLRDALAGLGVAIDAGRLEGSLAVSRESSDGPLSLRRLHLETHGLVARSLRESGELHSDRADLRVDATVDGSSGALSLDAAIIGATDGRPLTRGELRTTLPLDWLRSAPSIPRMLLAAATTPFTGDVTIPALDVLARKNLPMPWRTEVALLGGTITAHAHLDGTALSPRMSLHATARGLGALEADGPKLDLDAKGGWDDGDARLEARGFLGTRDGAAHPAVTVNGEMRRPARRLFGPSPPPEIRLDAVIDALPLALVPALFARGVRGTISGTLAHRDGGEMAGAGVPHLAVTAGTLEVAGARYRFGASKLTFRADALTNPCVEARLVSQSGAPGTLAYVGPLDALSRDAFVPAEEATLSTRPRVLDQSSGTSAPGRRTPAPCK